MMAQREPPPYQMGLSVEGDWTYEVDLQAPNTIIEQFVSFEYIDSPMFIGKHCK